MDNQIQNDCCAGLCGGCCIICTEAIQQWCFFNTWGSGSSTSQAGCCTRCCKKSFDDDDFDEELARANAAKSHNDSANGIVTQEPTGARAKPQDGPVSSQPQETKAMDSTPQPAGDATSTSR